MTSYIGNAALAAMRTALERIITDTGQSWALEEQPIAFSSRQSSGALPACPIVNLIRKSEGYERIDQSGAVSAYKATLTVTFDVISEGMAQSDGCSAIVHDVFKALRDHTLGGTVTDFSITSSEWLDAEQDTPTFGVRFTASMWWRFAENAPATRI